MQKKQKTQKLAQKIKKCKKCPLWKTRIQAVPGEGNWQTKIIIIGEAPGQEEDKQGKPFCGRAGKFLDQLLKIANLKREKIFITNIVKCRPLDFAPLGVTRGKRDKPPKNRPPKKEEIAACRPWLEEQIKILKPKLIITLGSFALNWFLPDLKISEVRNHVFQFAISDLRFAIFPSYHPAAAFRRGSLRKILKKDFRKIKKITKRLI